MRIFFGAFLSRAKIERKKNIKKQNLCETGTVSEIEVIKSTRELSLFGTQSVMCFVVI